MISTQVQRLQQDSEAVKSFIEELMQEGNHERVKAFELKKEFIDAKLTEIMTS